MPPWWTKRSFPPSSGVMKPYPLSSLNHLTIPVANALTSLPHHEQAGKAADRAPVLVLGCPEHTFLSPCRLLASGSSVDRLPAAAIAPAPPRPAGARESNRAGSR